MRSRNANKLEKSYVWLSVATIVWLDGKSPVLLEVREGLAMKESGYCQ